MSIRPASFGRRAFLGTTAAATVLAPFVPLLDRDARGGAAELYPTRIVFLFSPNGAIHENWVPSGTQNDFTLDTMLAPLQPHKDRLVVLDGLRILQQGLGDPHQIGIGSLWTGSKLLPGSFQGNNGDLAGYAGGISVDQHIASAIADDTPYKSLELGVLARDANNWKRMVYAGPDQPLAPEDNPRALFQRLFAGIDPQAAERLRAERRSVIDHVEADLASLTVRYGSRDRMKIEAHLQAVRAIELRNETVMPACDVMPMELALDFEENDNFPELTARLIDQLVLALACDLTRVASFQWSGSSSLVAFSWLGQSSAHHSISHLPDDDPAMVDQMTAVGVWYAEQVRYLLDRLAAVPEGDGTLLDHTLVVWGNELGRGNVHSGHPVPFVLAGGANGRMEMGRYLDSGDAEHNRLLVSLCHVMGLDEQTTFGDTDPSSGGLPGLL